MNEWMNEWMNDGWILIMGEYDLYVNMNYGWIWIMGGGTDKHTDTDTHHYHDSALPRARAE